jgi:hypothetical protein
MLPYYSSTSSFVHAKSTDKCTCFKCPFIFTAVHSSLESTECGNKKEHKVENGLPMNALTSY